MPQELKDTIDSLGTAFEQFKQANDERLKQIEKSGKADPLLEEKVNKLSVAIGELDAAKTKIEQLENAVARKARTTSADGVDLDAKAQQWVKGVAQRGRRVAPEQFGAKELGEYKQAFADMMRRGEHVPSIEKALSVGSDPDGGYTVAPDTGGRIIEKIYETSPMRMVASVQSIGTDALEGLFDLDEAGAGWVGEIMARPKTSTPKLGPWKIPVHELYANPAATQKLLDDSEIDIESWLAGKVSESFARLENTAFVSGDGVDKPRGFLTYPAGTTLPDTIEQKLTGANGAFAGSGAGADILFDTIAAMKQGYRSGARWHMNRLTTAAVRKLKDSEGRYLWMPSLEARQPATLAGYGILEFDDMPAIETGSLSIAFANFREGYQIVDRQGIRVLRDPYTSKPYVHFYTVKRTGGDVVNFEAIKLIKFSQA